MTDEQDGAFIALASICAALAGEIAVLRGDLTRKPAASHLEVFLRRLEEQLPAALASLQDVCGPEISKSYELQIERFGRLCREQLSFS